MSAKGRLKLFRTVRMRGSEEHAVKGASSAQMLRHGVFAVAVGVVGAAASVVLCLVVGWAYDLVCAHGWLLYLLPFSRWRAFCCTAP